MCERVRALAREKAGGASSSSRSWKAFLREPREKVICTHIQGGGHMYAHIRYTYARTGEYEIHVHTSSASRRACPRGPREKGST